MIVTDLDCWFTLTTDNEERMTGQEYGLLPCPFCGGDADINNGCAGDTTEYFGECMTCGACGQRSDTEDEAAEAWNYRAALAAEPTRAPDGWIAAADVAAVRRANVSAWAYCNRRMVGVDARPVYIGAAQRDVLGEGIACISSDGDVVAVIMDGWTTRQSEVPAWEHRYPGTRAVRIVLVGAAPAPADTREQEVRCVLCGHAPHEPGRCLNMTSDNDCNCGDAPADTEDV